MPKASYEFGPVTRLTAEAVGEPGRRTFRLLADSSTGSAVLWLEKEQLLELSLSIKKALGLLGLGEDAPRPSRTDSAVEDTTPGALSVEFKVGKQAIEYDREDGIFRFWNHDVEGDEEEDAKLVFDATSEQVKQLSDEALTVCAAGRPICPLCHQPIDAEGHFCSRSNGHPTNAAEKLG
ncbi:MAG: DUF3090 family protein [Dehalococcoidia bacterium]